MTPGHSTIPLDIRIHLRKLTMIEEMLLSPVLPVMSVFKLRTGQNIHRVYVANYRQESASLIDEVPRLANRIPVVIVKRCGQDNTSAECKVNRLRVQAVGQFLAQNHPVFVRRNITFIQENCSTLPENDVPNCLSKVIEDDDYVQEDDLGPNPV